MTAPDDPRTLAAGRCMVASTRLLAVVDGLDKHLPRTTKQEAESERMQAYRARFRRDALDYIERLAAEVRREGEAAGLVEPAAPETLSARLRRLSEEALAVAIAYGDADSSAVEEIRRSIEKYDTPTRPGEYTWDAYRGEASRSAWRRLYRLALMEERREAWRRFVSPSAVPQGETGEVDG